NGGFYGIYAQRYRATGPVTGKLFNDKNANRRKESREPGLFKWRVFIDTDNDGVWDRGEVSVLTNRSGNWKLKKVPFGSQRIRVVLKRGWKQTTPRKRVLLARLNGDHPSLSNRIFGVRRI